VNSHFGVIDIAGMAKDLYYYYKSVWRPHHPVVRLVPHHWDWWVICLTYLVRKNAPGAWLA
jgi:hypothetical protein